MATNPRPKEQVTRRLFVRRENIQRTDYQLSLFDVVRIELVGIGCNLSERLSGNPKLIHSLSPDEFEDFICNRLHAMGFEPRQIGSTFQADGGVDVIFWPRGSSSFPFLGAAQIKHHQNPKRREGPGTVRDFWGSISGRPFSAGIIVTNTSFSPSAEWFARQQNGLIRLRGFEDICRWLENNFSSEAEWREIPSTIELAPGMLVKIR
ncbi:MAG: restriction endonuclease [Desulfobacterales bacterium]|nr:restriction endonuclease [Desulfobacterales bacterium]